jgi:hypothetical protein
MPSSPNNNGKDVSTAEDWPKAMDRLATSQKSANENRQVLKNEEASVRLKIKQSPLVLFVLNGIATVLIFLFHLISLESLLSISLSVTLTVYAYLVIDDDSDFNGGIMTWTLLTFAIVTPMSASINMGFTRREKALTHIAALRSLCFAVYQAHTCWDWGTLPNTGRAKSKVDWLEHSDTVLKEIIQIGDDLTRYLTLPSTSRARHRIMPRGKKQAKDCREIGDQLVDSILTGMNRISLYCEILKLEGLPGNEASRVRQWEREIVLQIEGLQVIKEYRTPQALRSLCRIFSVFLPPFYAPYYAQMARELNSLGMAIVFSILTSVALTALFESLTQMEDPFVAHLTLDGIDVPRELGELLYKRLMRQRNTVFFSKAGVPAEGLRSEQLTSPNTDSLLRIFGE